jgi:GTP pyrophosphokinase
MTSASTEGNTVKDTNLPPLAARFEQALAYAHQLHAHQLRKGTMVPYIAHLMSVAALVLESGGDEDEAIAALLHDAVEDQGGQATLLEIQQRFGDRVAAIVAGCSDTDTIPKPPWQERKEQYLHHLQQAPPEVIRVSIADKLHNARAILLDYRQHGDALWQRFNGGREGTLWYYRRLVSIYRTSTPMPGTSPASSLWCLIEELERVVAELEALASTAQPTTEL